MVDTPRDETQAPPRLDPRNAQYSINLTPEQHEALLKGAAKEPPPPRVQIEMGGSGTAKVSFKDAADGDVEVKSADWSSTGPVTVQANEDDPTSATITPTGLGSATVTAVVSTDTGSAQASTEVMVIDKIGAPVTGTIEITADAPDDAQREPGQLEPSQVVQQRAANPPPQ